MRTNVTENREHLEERLEESMGKLTVEIGRINKEQPEIKKAQREQEETLHQFIDKQLVEMGSVNTAIQQVARTLDEVPTNGQVRQMLQTVEATVRDELGRRGGGGGPGGGGVGGGGGGAVDDEAVEAIMHKLRDEMEEKASRAEVC